MSGILSHSKEAPVRVSNTPGHLVSARTRQCWAVKCYLPYCCNTVTFAGGNSRTTPRFRWLGGAFAPDALGETGWSFSRGPYLFTCGGYWLPQIH